MAYRDASLNGGGGYGVRITVTHAAYLNATNESSFAWSVTLLNPLEWGAYDSGSNQTWHANIGGIPLTGTFVLVQSERYNKARVIASGTVKIKHDAEGYRPAFNSNATITTNHDSVGSGSTGNLAVGAGRIAKRPSIVRNVRLTDTKPTTLTIGFDAPADSRGSAVTGYLVRWSTTPPAETAPFTDIGLPASARSCTITDLRPGTSYYVVVYARNGATWDGNGYSDKSAQLAPRTISGVYVWSGVEWRPSELLVYTATGWKSAEVRANSIDGWKEAA